ncbi:MAG: caspase family protein [Rhodopirellula sp.]|nr:caspase family protein [Rhodopirellula sp.]
MGGRRKSEAYVVPALILFAGLMPPATVVADRTRPVEPSARVALLVGVGQYPNLGPAKQLDGAVNDVRAMRQLLIERFQFQSEDIVTLADRQATSQRIREELVSLAERAHAHSMVSIVPSQVVFHFSGHGSQMPDQPEGHPDCDEEDGLDETLVPYDAQQQGGDEDIRDDELNRLFEQIRTAAPSRVWVVLDCCHSGTGVRGATKIRKLDRGLSPALPVSGAQRRIVRKHLPDDVVFLSACRANEVEPEYRDGDGSHGLLTRFLTRVLAEQPSLSSLSYELLRSAVIGRYRQEAVVQSPTPQLEGNQDTVRGAVLGVDEAYDRKPYWRVEPAGNDRSRANLIAGSLFGITSGSLFELYENPEQIDWIAGGKTGLQKTSLGWLEIDKVEGATAEGRVFRWDDQRQERIAQTLPFSFRQGYAVERFHQHGDFSMRVRVVRATGNESDGPPLLPREPGVPEAIRAGIESAKSLDESQWLRWTGENEACDVVIRFDGSYAAVFPAIGIASLSQRVGRTRGDVPESLCGGWGPIDLRGPVDAAEQIADYLRRIARARNLIRVAASQAARRSSDLRVDLRLLSVELDDALQIRHTEPWRSDATGSLVMREDDLFALEAANGEAAGKPAYVTVLVVDPDMEIQVVLPYQAGDGLIDEQRLAAGATRISDPYRCTPPSGTHYAILLATREPNEFHRLAQSRLPRTRSADGGPILDELFLEQMYFQTRGSRRQRPQKLYDDSWFSAVLRWDATSK